MPIDDNNKYKNKLNIKDDLQNYWEKEEKKEEKKEKVNDNIKTDNNIKIDSYINNDLKEENKEMPINNEWTKNKNFNMNYNNDDNNNKSKIIAIAIISFIAGYIVYEIYSYIQTKKENDKIINQQIIEYNKQVIEKQKALNAQNRQQNQTYNQNYNNYKYFKINYEYEKAEDIYDRDFRINMDVITRNLGNIKSRSDDNNYDIEISGNISKYGGMFYRIYKRKQSSEYDNEIINILNELKKYKFRIQEESINFKIYMNNNSMNLNYK